jgi:predicted RNase H-like nuclease (RuvC/YqgF family)
MDVVWVGTTIGGITGALLGATAAWTFVSRRAHARHTRWLAAARDQLAASTQSTRATNVRLQADLEKERASVQKKVLASTAEQRKVVSRLEGELRLAYAEIDRLNGEVAELKGDSAAASLVDGAGFAQTRPYSR